MTIEGAALLEIRNLGVIFGEVRALDQVNLTVWAGQIVSVVGPNGAGKTTLMKAVAGLIRAVQGEVAFLGEPIQGLPPYEVVRRGLVYIPEGMRVFPLMSVLENLEVGAYTARDRKAEQLSFVFALFPVLAEKRSSPAGTLSGGQKRMLTIARGLMSGARLLLLDDPFLGLAPKDVSRLCRTLKDLRGHGITLFLAGQHVRRILRVAGRAYLIEEGRITLSGTGDQLLDHPHLQESLFGMMAKAGSLE
ncbi:MAG: transporter related protein [Deltaproteobacteria bacterium]|jgi:branched-chain amino acid transport system ATP-binding protein|nr:transporter related protein [Deltaproteobacteria bacterium]